MAIYAWFAEILDYPSPALAAQVRDWVRALAGECSEAAEWVSRFQTQQARMTLSELQELYTATFELQPDCTPNLGYHLFGNDSRRNMFLAQLKQRMERHQVAMGSELPDHLSLILRLLERQDSDEERSTLIADCLVPAVSRMVEVLEQRHARNAYEDALRALLVVLQKESREKAAPLEALRVSGESKLV